MPPVFAKIKTHVLGGRYDLSAAFLTPAQMRKAMHYKRTRARKTSNVLAFSLSKTSGEVLICPRAAAPFSLPYLFIHGCLHVKGFRHGARMESEERRVLARFSLSKWQKSSSESTSARTTSRSSSPKNRKTRASRRAS